VSKDRGLNYSDAVDSLDLKASATPHVSKTIGPRHTAGRVGASQHDQSVVNSGMESKDGPWTVSGLVNQPDDPNQFPLVYKICKFGQGGEVTATALGHINKLKPYHERV
jgi:hypothetical protein